MKPLQPVPFRVILVTDWAVPGLLARAEAAAAAGGPLVAVYHRHPDATDREYVEEGRRLAALLAPHGTHLFASRRADVAICLGAHLHLPSSALEAAEVRALVPDRWISAAVHDERELQPGVDLIVVSPVFRPSSKPHDGRPLLGVDGAVALARAGGVPTFALGGLTAERARELPAELAGVAVMGAAWSAADPAAMVSALLDAAGRG